MTSLATAHPLVEAEDRFFELLRKTEYDILDKQNQVYLDYTGGNLYAKSQVLRHQSMLLDNVLGNPHSTNPTSQRSTQLVAETRRKVLDFFNAHDYTCVFTANASGALKIVGESFPFEQGSRYVLLSDNHNSVNGIREFCKKKNGTTSYVPVNYEDLMIDSDKLVQRLDEADPSHPNLFAYPAQSNVSGIKHDLKWIEIAQQKGFHVLLDAAAFVPSSRLNLSVVKPDFVSLSFYKIFGYPTGIGCLLIKNSSFDVLQKTWFAGGTVSLVSVAAQHQFLAGNYERFEDGTLNYNNIPAIKTGLEYIELIGIDRISKRVKSLAIYLADGLKKLRHSNGQPIVRIFGPETFTHRGGNLMMNFFDRNGRAFPFEDIEKMANDRNISIRSGCFCNPGIDEIKNCITNQEISRYFSGRSTGDYFDMVAFLGKMRGATRVSLGLATIKRDIDQFVEMVKTLKDQTLA